MKKFNVTPRTAKRLKVVAAAALAVTLAVPTSTYFSSKAANKVEAEEAVTVPTPIMQVDFETGFLGEKAKNGLDVVKSDEVQIFLEKLDETGGQPRVPETGAKIYDMTDKPVIQGIPPEYKKGVVGNQPTTTFDNAHNSVLYLNDTVKVPEFFKKESDSLDEKYKIGTKLQDAYSAESQIKLTNPFAGKKLASANEYGAGVSISYWVKVPNVIDEKTNKVKDSDLIVFNNLKRQVVQKDDDAKRRACLAYDEAVKNNDTEALKDYALGDQKVVTDADGETYTLYENYGKFVRLNPNYPKYVDDKETTKKGGWYAPAKEDDAKITAKDASGKEYKIASLAMGTTEDTNQYDNFRYLYKKDADKSDGYYDKSKVRSEVIEGGMQITAQNDFHFREDDIITYTPEGQDTNITTDGAIITNPNSAEKGNQQDFFGSNQFYFDGDETVTDAPEVWHYVTIVIQNDWVEAYVDGVYKDPEMDFIYWKEDAANKADFGARNTDKTFNQGKGLRAPFSLDANNIGTWPASGTLQTSPANSYGITMLDWLTDKDTELFIGGVSCAADCFKQDKGTVGGTLMDDITFYDVPLTKAQAVQAYKDAAAASDKGTAIPDPITKVSFDDGTMNGTNSFKMDAAPSNGKDLDPSVAIDAERGNVLKVEASKAGGTSAVKLDKNPFAGKSLTGATVNYWMKMAKPGKSTGISFQDTLKVKDHDKINTTWWGTESATLLYVDSAMESMYQEGCTNGVYMDLKNKFKFSVKKNDYTDKETSGILYDEESVKRLAEYTDMLKVSDQWRMITAVFTNCDIQLYLNGEKLSNNQVDENGIMNCFGPRFFDGYYQTVYDGYARFHAASNNQFATPLLTFLTDATTSAYVGFQNEEGAEKTYVKTKESYFDDIAYYDVALTAEQIKILYSGAPEPVVPTQGPVEPTDNPGSTGNQPTDNTVKAGLTKNPDGTYSAEFGGVKLTAAAGVLDVSAQVTLGVLGSETSSDTYAKFKDKLAANKDFATANYTVYTVNATVSGAAAAVNGKFELTLDIPNGYDPKAVVVVGEDGTVYEGTVSADGKKITIKTDKFGNYAVVLKDMSTDDGSTLAGAASKSGKTGDTANVVVPFIILAIAGATLAASYRKKAFQK